MLDAMRRGAQTWVAKLLFGLLVASFAVWGIGDVFTGWGRGSVATVGSTDISVEEFNREFQRELEQISREARRKLTPDEGRALGIDRRVISQLLGSAALEADAASLGLAISDETLLDSLQNDPSLKDATGKFSKEAFYSFLRQQGLSERAYFALYRRDKVRLQLLDSLVEGLVVPKAMIDIMHAYRDEKRTVEWVTIDADKKITVPEPTDDQLKERYETFKKNFMTPEYRGFNVLMLSVDDLKKQVPVTDEEIAKEYAATKDTYDKPEQRRVQQIAFKDKAAADAALKALRDGSKSFADVAKDAGAKDTDVDLGLVSKKALADPKIADAAFAIEKDKFSDVIEGRLVTAILRVTQIEPGKMETLDGVKEQVKDKIATQKAREILQTKHDEIDDQRFAGKTLKEIGESLKIFYQEVAAADQQGVGKDGNPVLTTPDLRRIMADVFAADAGQFDQAIELASGAYAWVTLGATEEPKQKPFEEVKEPVKADFMAAERDRLVTELAKKLVARVNSGDAMSAIAVDAGGKVEKSEPFTRTTLPHGLSENAVAQTFALAQGKAGSAKTADEASRTIFKVVDITPAPEATPGQVSTLRNQLREGYKSADGYVDGYVSQEINEYAVQLKKRYNASINEVELKRALGVSEQ